MKNVIKYWLPIAVYAGCIFYASSLPAKDIPGLFPYQDIVFHFFEYAGFAFLISRAIKISLPEKSRLNRLLLVMAIAVAYAVLDEFHQVFVPGRTATLIDVIVDASGSLVAALLYNRL